MSCNSIIIVVGQLYIGDPATSVSGGLPPGLTFPSIFGDRVGGTPDTIGEYRNEVDGVPTTWYIEANSNLASWTPNPSTFEFTTGEYAEHQLTPTGSTGAVGWFVYNDYYPLCPPLADSLPAGITFSADGLFSGTPDPGTQGTYQIEIGYVDADFHSPIGFATIHVTAGVNPPVLACYTPPAGIVGIEYSYFFCVEEGTGTEPFTWSVDDESLLPPGLTFDSATGIISGTPTTAGTYPFSVTVTDALDLSDTQPVSITIDDVPPPPATGNIRITLRGVKRTAAPRDDCRTPEPQPGKVKRVL